MATKVLKQLTLPIYIQGDGSTTVTTFDLTASPFDLTGHPISQVSGFESTGTYAVACLLNGSIAGILSIATTPAIANNVVALIALTVMYS